MSYEEQQVMVSSLSELVETQSHETGQQFDPRIVKLFDEHFDEFLKVLAAYPDDTFALQGGKNNDN